MPLDWCAAWIGRGVMPSDWCAAWLSLWINKYCGGAHHSETSTRERDDFSTQDIMSEFDVGGRSGT